MLPRSTLQFLKDLSKNNNREWFEANRNRYESARQDFIGLADAIIKSFCKKDSDFTQLEGKKCLFR
ncbi:MAG: hypothetical protein K0Q66_62, partial [Chitinophagaceae bacterium]|nr:hypothetical protein [Chitinophagaceae bacterium]